MKRHPSKSDQFETKFEFLRIVVQIQKIVW